MEPTKQTEAMKLALEALEWNMDYLPSQGHGTSMASKAISALREALAEQPAQQEPVAWLEILRNNKTATDEVIGAFLRGHAEHLTRETFVLSTPAAPQPVQRKPLTDEFLRKLHHEDQFGLFCDYDEFEQIARAIEAAHGIKENT